MRSITMLQGWAALGVALSATYHSVGTTPRDDWVPGMRHAAERPVAIQPCKVIAAYRRPVDQRYNVS